MQNINAKKIQELTVKIENARQNSIVKGKAEISV